MAGGRAGCALAQEEADFLAQLVRVVPSHHRLPLAAAKCRAGRLMISLRAPIMPLKGTDNAVEAADNLKVSCSFAAAHPVAFCGYLFWGAVVACCFAFAGCVCAAHGCCLGPFALWAFAQPTLQDKLLEGLDTCVSPQRRQTHPSRYSHQLRPGSLATHAWQHPSVLTSWPVQSGGGSESNGRTLLQSQ